MLNSKDGFLISRKELSEKLGISSFTVIKLLKKYNIQHIDNKIFAVTKMYSVNEIEKTLGVKLIESTVKSEESADLLKDIQDILEK